MLPREPERSEAGLILQRPIGLISGGSVVVYPPPAPAGPPVQLSPAAAPCRGGVSEAAGPEGGGRGLRLRHEPGQEGRGQQRQHQ